MKNDELHSLLKTWSPQVHTANEIRAGVWQRIERIEPNRWRVMLESLLAHILRPVLVTGLVAIAIIVGVTMGSKASESAQKQAYLNSVTAYRLPQ